MVCVSEPEVVTRGVVVPYEVVMPYSNWAEVPFGSTVAFSVAP